jgi:hypothetical protein
VVLGEDGGSVSLKIRMEDNFFHCGGLIVQVFSACALLAVYVGRRYAAKDSKKV